MSDDSRKVEAKVRFSLDHVAVTVSDLERSIEFYGRNFGFACRRVLPLGPKGRVALLHGGGLTIEMFAPAGALPLPEDRRTPDADLRTIGVKHFALRVADAMAASEFLKRNGVEFISGVTVGVRGVRRFFVKDPDGTAIEITEGPASPARTSGEETTA
jgi:catechol 2,3-dioxygenase-like lactoylglutathione lyase family enzyme